ncbi:hypothetical protein ACOCG7_23470 [Paraburkholderia sp. DD10]|uniref:hypothetical protein n=1 Tax=Paraburkholderia sp. DD10 TaxID=3409691 RepID=UPI003B9F6FC9
MEQSWNSRSVIEQAAAGSEGDKWVAAIAAANLVEAGRIERESAADKGTRIKVRQFVKLLDGSENWQFVLTELLIESPELASKDNATLCMLVGQKLGVAFDKQRLSRKLPNRVRTVVSRKLTDAGYDGSNVQLGTDIKRAVAGIRKSAEIPFAGNTEFYADGVRIDRSKLSYMLRPRATCTGNAWQDFCVKIAGDLVSLTVLLRMRAVSIGEFQAADEMALANADPDSLARRNALQRAAQAAPSRIEPVPTDASGLIALARIWWHELSPAKKSTAGFWDMAHYLRSQSGDRETAADAARWLDVWAERQTAWHAEILQPAKRGGAYVDGHDGALTKIDVYANPYGDTDEFEASAE